VPEVELLGRRVEQFYRERSDEMQFLELQRQVALLDEAEAPLRREAITQILRKLLGFDLEMDGQVCRAVPPGRRLRLPIKTSISSASQNAPGSYGFRCTIVRYGSAHSACCRGRFMRECSRTQKTAS
jgi:hypothetical protein